MGMHHFTIAAGKTTDTIVSSVYSVLNSVLITSIGVSSPTGYDNASTASGDIIFTTIASAPLGPYNMPDSGYLCANGITFAGGALMPGMTIFYTT